MKKFLLTLSSVFLFAASLSAQITLDTNNILPPSGSVFGRDEMRTIKFDSVHTLLHQRFDSAGHNFVADTFDGHGGAFMFDTSNSIHSSMLYITPDTSGFVIMDSEAMGDDTQRVTLTSPSFNTNGYNTLKVMINHHYRYSANDSAVGLYISTNGTTWDLVHSYSADMMDVGTSQAFGNDEFVLGPQYLNKNTVYLRLVYAAADGYQWAVNSIRVNADKYNYGNTFFMRPMPAFPVPANDTVLWDMSALQYDGGVKYYVRKAAPAPYRFIDSLYNEDLKGFQHTTYDQNYFTITGILAHAHLTYQHEVMLNEFTGANDTLSVPTTFVMQYSGLHKKVQYPMTYQDNWNSDFLFTEPFFLKGQTFLPITIGPKFLDCIRRVRIIEKDTVVGWGKLRIKGPDGTVFSYNDVLQVKVDYMQVDSFYLNPNAATAQKQALLDNYITNYSGLSNPNVQHYTKINYLREKELQPFVTVYMQDTFVTRVEVHIDRPWPLEVAAIETATNEVSVYPNPVADRTVHISVANAKDGDWYCEVLNTLGQNLGLQQLNIDHTNNNAAVHLPASIAAGLYYLHITKNGQTVTVKPLQVQ